MTVAKKEENHPLIVHVKDPENSLLNSLECFLRFRQLAEVLEGRVIFIGSLKEYQSLFIYLYVFTLASCIGAQREAKPQRRAIVVASGGANTALDLSILNSLKVIPI